MALQFAGYDGQAYAVSAVTGALATATVGEILQFRWSDTGTLRRIRILAVTMSAAVGATGFTAGPVAFSLSVARAWTAAGTGGTTLTLTGNNQKLRSSQNPTLFNTGGGEIRVATTAALGAGTKTIDANGISSIMGSAGAAGTLVVAPGSALWQDFVTPYGQPIVLAHQEGLSIATTVLPATGSLTAAFNIFWAEAD